MVLYIPQQAVEAVNDLLSKLPDDRKREFLLTVTITASRLIKPSLAAARPTHRG